MPLSFFGVFGSPSMSGGGAPDGNFHSVRLNNDGKQTVLIDGTGNAWFGSDIGDPREAVGTGVQDAHPDTTVVSIFSEAATFNGEDMAAGTVLIGSNSADRANLRWNPTTKRLEIRTGTNAYSYVDTDGTITLTTDNLAPGPVLQWKNDGDTQPIAMMAAHRDTLSASSDSFSITRNQRDGLGTPMSLTLNGTGISTGGQLRGASLRVDASPSASAATTTHKLPISLNGTTYYLLLSNV